jgi:ACS family hexuronate transporter-like MFS transporter
MSVAARRSDATESQPSSSVARWAAVSVFALASAWNYLDRLVLSAAAPRVKAEFHLTNTDYGFLLSAFALAYAIAAPAVGWLLDRIGLEVGIVVSVALWSVSAGICGISRTFSQLAFGRVFLGVWESAGVPAAGKLNSIYLAPKDLASGAAMTQIGIGIAGVGAPLLVAAFTGWRSPFFVCAALGLVWIPVWLWVRRTVRPWQAVAPRKQQGGFQLLLDRRLVVLSLANVLWMVGYTFWSNWTTIYLVETYRLTTVQASAYAWVPPVASTLGGFAGGWVSRRAIDRGMPPVEARVYGTLLSAIGCFITVLVPFAPTPLWALLPISASYFAIVAGSCNIYAIPLDIWGGERAGLAIASLGFAYGLLQTVVSPLIGWLVDHVGFGPVCWLVAVPPIAAWLLLRQTLVDETPAPALVK